MKKITFAAFLISIFAITSASSAESPRDFPEHLKLWGSEGNTAFYILLVGERMVLTAGPQQNNDRLILENYKTDQLNCYDVPSSYQESQNANQKWECEAIATGDSNSEVFFRVGSERSNTIVIQINESEQTSMGYCCAPNNPEFNQCQNLVSKDMCDAMSGTLSEFRNTGNCATCRSVPKPKVSCCFEPTGGGLACEQWRTEDCHKKDGRILDSCEQCWESYNDNPPPTPYPNPNIPPAGYEDEVLVNIEDYDNPFPDTSMSTLAGKAASELYRRAVIGGFPDGEFKGDRDVNRAEAAKFLLLARFGEVDHVSNNGRFPDVLDNQWYTKFVVTAANKGIISGHPDGTFRPANTVNTAEFLKMISLIFDLDLNTSYSYRDVSSSDWFARYAGIAERYNLFPDRSSYLSPGNSLTREEIAIAIYKFLKNRNITDEEYFSTIDQLSYKIYPEYIENLIPEHMNVNGEILVRIHPSRSSLNCKKGSNSSGAPGFITTKREINGEQGCMEESGDHAMSSTYYNTYVEILHDGKIVTIEWALREGSCGPLYETMQEVEECELSHTQARSSYRSVLVAEKIMKLLKTFNWYNTADEISNWQTYENEDLGIEFLYPKDWFATEKITKYNNRIYITNNKKIDYSTGSYPKNYAMFWIDYFDSSESTRMSYERSIEMMNLLPCAKTLIRKDNIDINICEFSDTSFNEGHMGPRLESLWIKGNIIFNTGTPDMALATNDIISGLRQNKIEVDIAKKILSTLKFNYDR